MTEIQCRTLRIPTREEFHKEWSGEITIDDFSTDHPNPNRLKEQMNAFRFNRKNKNIAREKK